ncbi:hypothetical protein PHYPSEUDO_007649 [Phytophthora pseudosyringae]|uniref:Uncharacterized protein n=1 Tax=Phytophthora pseudosyringae TaxID=221518 RepID=A0A8T1VG91_9STRA|nr:hypothetical protein PHYPSEUDO_007649 [Phytophthora pseudosyringae]
MPRCEAATSGGVSSRDSALSSGSQHRTSTQGSRTVYCTCISHETESEKRHSRPVERLVRCEEATRHALSGVAKSPDPCCSPRRKNIARMRRRGSAAQTGSSLATLHVPDVGRPPSIVCHSQICTLGHKSRPPRRYVLLTMGCAQSTAAKDPAETTPAEATPEVAATETKAEETPAADEAAKDEDKPAETEAANVEEPKVEEPKVEEPATVEEPAKVEEPTVEEPKVEEPATVEEPAKVEEAAKVEEPKAEEPTVEEPAREEEPKAEEPKKEEPAKVEELKKEETTA